MGIPGIVAAALRRVSWGQVASVAIQYGPDFFRKLKARVGGHWPGGEEAASVEALSERVRRLETILVKQDEMIQAQSQSIQVLSDNGKTLQARLNILTAFSAFAGILALVLLIILLRR